MSTPPSLWLLADIGATNLRFALYNPQQGVYRNEFQALVTQYSSLSVACQSYLEMHNTTINAAAIAIACPVLGDEVTITNYSWNFSQHELKRDLCLKHLVVINDLLAVAQAIPFLPEHTIHPLGPTVPIDVSCPKGVLAPGSGLGTATLIPIANDWYGFASEGGHVTLAATDNFEILVIAELAKRYGHVSAERLVSGQGIVNLYKAICDLGSYPKLTTLTAKAIVTAAETDPCAKKTLTYFSRFLGNIAGNLALSLGARGGIYLAGGIIPELGKSSNVNAFRTAFENKGRFSAYLRTVPTFSITHPLPAYVGLQKLILEITSETK